VVLFPGKLVAEPRYSDAPEGPGAGATLLRCKGLTRSFAAVRALRGVDFSITAGRIRGLVGENGAGKSTLAKIIAGVHAPESGTMEFEGRPARFIGAEQALKHRIVTVHQDINLVQTMSVSENLLLANEPTYRLGIIRRKAMRAAAERLLEKYEVGVDPDDTVGSLPNDLKKMVQIIKAVSLRPKILILDEPTSSLTDAQVRIALRVIQQLASQGVGLVLISHYLAEIFEVCHDLTVLRDGEVVLDRSVRQTTLPQVVAAMVGRKVEISRRRAHVGSGVQSNPLMAVENLTSPGVLRDVSFTLGRGEVLGVTGLAGSGLRELSKGLFGASGRRTFGRILIQGTPVPAGDPSASLSAGMALLTSDRLGEGILPDFALVENICLPILSRFRGLAGALDFGEMERTTERNIQRLHIHAPGPSTLARQLSGGNQQKVLFAKWLETKPKVFVMDEPTIGIDVGAKEEIRKIIDEISGAGVGIVLVTTELDELVLLCDRVLVMFRGAIIGELSGEAVNRESILHAAACGAIRAIAA
jgi:ABC-type sugar transport system ATPase subunit